MDWEIQFSCVNFSPIFIHKLFYFLVSRGVKYNAGKYEGYYQILGKEPNKDIEFREKELGESTEKLAEIIDTYLKFDLTTTTLSIDLDYLGKVDFGFWVYLCPRGNGCFISFGTHRYLIPDENAFFAFVNLCKEVFERFDFVYGASRNEYQGFIPSNKEDFLKEKTDIVNFYSKPLVGEIGREKLLSAPAFKVEELESGGVMLIVCTNPFGCDNIYEVWRHLGYG